jgi:hypothetical protein
LKGRGFNRAVRTQNVEERRFNALKAPPSLSTVVIPNCAASAVRNLLLGSTHEIVGCSTLSEPDLRDNMAMPTRKRLGLSTFDGQLLEGLDFCGKVYDLFDQVKRGPDGIAKLRLRPTKNEKRLLEELIPIARYVQARYREGRRIKVRWLSGSQPYDAVLWSSGELVKHRMAPKKILVEVTTSVHQNDYLARKLLHERGGSFGVKGVNRDRETGEIISKPHVRSNDEIPANLANQIIERLKRKSEKKYPLRTVLIVNCIPNNLILESEWSDAVERVKKAQAHLAFLEVFLLEAIMSHSATLYGKSHRPRGSRR